MLVKIEQIYCKDLYNTGTTFDPQDPAVEITIGSKVVKTSRFVISLFIIYLMYQFINSINLLHILYIVMVHQYAMMTSYN